MTFDEIKNLIRNCPDVTSGSDAIKVGKLKTLDDEEVTYELRFGWDLVVANKCDDSWGSFNIELLRFIKNQEYEDEELGKILENIQMDDNHWRWLNKSFAYKDASYRWFFAIAESYPQSACLIYHPKPSATHGKDIFYVEYLAVAPWNRWNPMRRKSFVGLGKQMISDVCEYCQDVLKWSPGFSLHSLPKAAPFYASIGMKEISSASKDGLTYFEAPEGIAFPKDGKK